MQHGSVGFSSKKGDYPSPESATKSATNSYYHQIKNVAIWILNLLLRSIKGSKPTTPPPAPYVAVLIKVAKKLHLHLSHLAINLPFPCNPSILVCSIVERVPLKHSHSRKDSRSHR